MTTFSSSHTNLTVILRQSHDCSYYVSRPILAPPRLWLQKHTDLRAHDFAHCPDLWHQPWLPNVTCEWSWVFLELILLYLAVMVTAGLAVYRCQLWSSKTCTDASVLSSASVVKSLASLRLTASEISKWLRRYIHILLCRLKTWLNHINYEGLIFEHLLFYIDSVMWGLRGSAVGWGTALQAGRSRVRIPVGSFGFFIDLILPAAPWP